jgi:HMG (high mobility group) box
MKERASSASKRERKDERKSNVGNLKDDSDSGSRDDLEDADPDKEDSVDNMATVVGARWKKLTPAQRRPFIEMAALDQQRYRQEMDVYREKLLRETAIGTAYLERQSKQAAGAVAGETSHASSRDPEGAVQPPAGAIEGSVAVATTTPGGETNDAVAAGQPQGLPPPNDSASTPLGRSSIDQWLALQQANQNHQAQVQLGFHPSNLQLPLYGIPLGPSSDPLHHQLLALNQSAQLQSLQQLNPMQDLMTQLQQYGHVPQQTLGTQGLLYLLQQQQQQQLPFVAPQLQLGVWNPMAQATPDAWTLQDQLRYQQQMQNMLNMNSQAQSLQGPMNPRFGESFLSSYLPIGSQTSGGGADTQEILRRAIEATNASLPPSQATPNNSSQHANLAAALPPQQEHPAP